jgi:hypothetical protein
MNKKRVYLLVIIFFLACKASKIDDITHTEHSIKNYDITNSESKKIKCDTIKSDGFRTLCLFELAFHGNKSAINKLIEKIHHNPNIIYSKDNKKRRMRGAELFQIVLELSNDFTCDHNLETDGVSGVAKFHYIAKNFKDMIEEIDGFKNVNKYIFSQQTGKIYDFKNEKCDMETLYRMDWMAINKAWQDGKIKLKEFGQE